MKRSKHQDEKMEESSDEEAEMDIDDEEKDGEPASAEESEDEDSEMAGNDGNVFFDTFYGLSSSDPRERAQAAKEMMEYCLVGPSANIKDASYALKRLLNGLCSGRAAARQGNASALSTFLKFSYITGKLKEIQNESSSEEEKAMSLLAYVRHRLRVASEPGKGEGTRRGSEDRDYKFGRLFGILSVIRSEIMLPTGDNRPELSDILETATGFASDLSELYAYKKWMREPAAHAIGTLLSSFYAVCLEQADAQTVVDQLVHKVVVPERLLNGDVNAESTSLLASYSAEQAAIALHIQTHANCHLKLLPKPLDRPVLVPETVQILARALSETSSVTHPRTHLFWDIFASYISEPTEDSGNVQTRKLRETCPVGGTSAIEMIDSVLCHVVISRLLGMKPIDDGQKETAKTTHERSALGLCIVRNLVGAEFVSSLTGRTRLSIDPETMESVILKLPIVRHLLLNILSAGEGGRKKQSAHLLRPLALQVLGSLTEAVSDSEDDSARRLAIVRPLLRCDSRFDAKTKSSIVDQVVQFSGDRVQVHTGFWDKYLEFLEEQVLRAGSEDSKAPDTITPYEALGFVDLVFNFGKVLARFSLGPKNLAEYKQTKTRSVLAFLLASAFYDCHNVESNQSPTKKKKGRKGKNISQHPSIDMACLVKSQRKDRGLLPYQLRCALSSRFYSLIAEVVASIAHSTADNKESAILETLSDLSSACQELEAAGAVKLGSVTDDLDENDESDSPLSIVQYLTVKAKADLENSSDTKSPTRERFLVTCATLGTTLFLHLLDCGAADSLADEDLDADDENDSVEVAEYLADLKQACLLFTKTRNQDDDDPLTTIAGLCATILSSPISTGSHSKGGYPRLLRETVKAVWVSALGLAASNDYAAIHPDVLSILLESIGASDIESMDVEDNNEEEESGSEADTVGDSVDSADVFGKAAEDPDVLGDDEAVEDKHDKPPSDDEGSVNVEINPDRLRAFLEEESDADVDENELEHHEGADAALAKLIQIKQEARKAGQSARERTEVARQLRCSLLLETLLNGKPDGWGKLLSTDSALKMIEPMLAYRRELENAVLKATGKSDEKRNMAEKLTSLLKTKIFKMKGSDRLWTDTVDATEFCTSLAARVFEMMRGKMSKEQRSCCSQALAVIIRSVPDSSARIEVGEIYTEIVNEWSTKRTTRLESSMLEDFIQLCPIVAQASLCMPLTNAVNSARSLYLKTEATRLMSLIFNANLNPRKTDVERKAFKCLTKSLGPTLEAFCCALQDPDTKKSKRGKDLLKALTKVIAFIAVANESVPFKEVNTLKRLVEQLKNDTESKPLCDACTKLLTSLETLDLTASNKVTEQDPANSDEEEDEHQEPISKSEGKTKKEKKKKGKKKKKR